MWNSVVFLVFYKNHLNSIRSGSKKRKKVLTRETTWIKIMPIRLVKMMNKTKQCVNPVWLWLNKTHYSFKGYVTFNFIRSMLQVDFDFRSKSSLGWGCKFTPLPFWLNPLPPKQRHYFHGQELECLFATLNRRRRGQRKKTCNRIYVIYINIWFYQSNITTCSIW